MSRSPRSVTRLQVYGGEVPAASDTGSGQTVDDRIPAAGGTHAHHVDKPTDPAGWQRKRRQDEIAVPLQALIISHRDRFALQQDLFEARDLSQPQRAIDFREAVVVPKLAMLKPIIGRIPALIAQSA